MKRLALLFLSISAFAGDFSASAEYLCWWLEKTPNPVPFVVEFGADIQAELGEALPDSKIILGDRDIAFGARNGGRFTIRQRGERFGLQTSYFYLPNSTRSESVGSAGSDTDPFLLIPYFDVTQGIETSEDLSFPMMYAAIATLAISNGMQSAEALFTAKVYDKPSWDISVLTGFKWFYFRERLTFTTSSPFVDPPPSDVFQTEDSFRARNNFFGGLTAVSASFLKNGFSLELIAKLSVGMMINTLKIEGVLLTNFFNNFQDVQTFPGGYFALPTNMGQYAQNELSVIPEANLHFHFPIFSHLNFDLGYSFLYATNVLWAANSIDQNINPTQSPAFEESLPATLVGPAYPQPLFTTQGLWAQGFNLGLTLTY